MTTQQDDSAKNDDGIVDENAQESSGNQDDQIMQLINVAKQATADLQNYKKRNEEEKKQLIKFANAGLILEILQIVDTFDRSLKAMPSDLADNEWVKGMQGIDRQLHQILEKQGLKKIESVGQKLDPNFHEAIMQGDGERNIVIEEFEAGYMLNEKVIRPAKVKVGNS